MYTALVRAQKIVLELNTSLNHEADEQLCGKLASLYNYVYRRLVDANLERDDSPIHEAIRLIEYERETWVMVMRKLEQEPGGASQEPAPNPVGRIAPTASDAAPRPTATAPWAARRHPPRLTRCPANSPTTRT